MSNFAEFAQSLIFPLGNKMPDNLESYFSGQAYLNMLSDKNLHIGNVTFEAGCRNNWHIHHHGGQILLVTAGKGYYQEWNKPVQKLTVGDIVNVPADVKHWHGATADSHFSHIAIEIPATNAYNEWLEPVNDTYYNNII